MFFNKNGIDQVNDSWAINSSFNYILTLKSSMNIYSETFAICY